MGISLNASAWRCSDEAIMIFDEIRIDGLEDQRSRGSRRIVDFENYDHASVSTGGGSRWWARQKKSSTRIAEWKRRLSLAKWKPWSVRKRRVWVGITMGTMDTGESLHADEMQRHSSRWCALGTKIFRLDSTEGTLPDVGSREQGNFLETFLLFFPLLPSSLHSLCVLRSSS